MGDQAAWATRPCTRTASCEIFAWIVRHSRPWKSSIFTIVRSLLVALKKPFSRQASPTRPFSGSLSSSRSPIGPSRSDSTSRPLANGIAGATSGAPRHRRRVHHAGDEARPDRRRVRTTCPGTPVRKLGLDRQVALGFGLAMFVLVAVGSASYLTVSHFIGASRLAVRNAEIVTPLQRVLALAYEAETSQRGFLVSGADGFLAQRDRAMDETRQTLRELRELARGDDALLARVDRLATIAEARFGLFDEILRAREQAGDGSRELAALGLGREQMAGLAREVNLLAAERNALLRSDAEAARSAGQRVFAAFFVALAAVVALLVYILRLILREIAARQKAFHELAQSQARQAELVQELKAANEELGSFAYAASHDLKAPLRAIASLAQWLSADQAPKFDDEGREQMALLLGRVKRMDRLIDGILEYSRVGRVKQTRSRIDLNALVADTVDLLAPPAHVCVEVGPLPTIVIERTRAQQVFQNLIGNAIQYMDKPHGTIRVDCRADGGDWHFRVEDNGPGIEQRHFDRIFQMFQSLTARDKKESTGIGLTLVRKIVEMHGGRIWVESRMGAGSTFHFTLARSAVSDP